MKKIIVMAIVILLSFSVLAKTKVSFFGEDDYKRLLDKYAQKIHNNEFNSDEFINEVKDIKSQLVLKLIDDIKEMLKVQKFFGKNRSNISHDINKLNDFVSKSKSSIPATIGELEIEPVSVKQYIAKRAYVNSPYHYPITDWKYSTSDKEPYTIGIIGSHENSSINYNYEQAYAKWYRILITFDLMSLTDLPQPLNILDAYLKIEKVNSRWGIGDSNALSIGMLSTTETSVLSKFDDIDNYATSLNLSGKVYGYGTARESIKFADMKSYIEQVFSGLSLTDTKRELVIPFEPLSDKDFGNRFYATGIKEENIKLIIRYEN